MEQLNCAKILLQPLHYLMYGCRSSLTTATAKEPSTGLGPVPQAALLTYTNQRITNKQTFKVRRPQRAARSKRPNTPSHGSKNNGFHTHQAIKRNTQADMQLRRLQTVRIKQITRRIYLSPKQTQSRAPTNKLQITSWPHTGGARYGAKLGSMGI